MREAQPASTPIRTEPSPSCRLCGTRGVALYADLEDHLFSIPGRWGFTRCPSCALIWLDPMPLGEDLGRAYVNYHTHASAPRRLTMARRLHDAVRDAFLQVSYGYVRGAGPRWYRLLLPLAYLNPGGPAEFEADAMFLRRAPAGARLLDVGCGSGDRLLRLQALGWEVEGVDVDPVAVEVARASGVSARVGSVKSQGYPAGRFEAICMNHVLEHVDDPVDLLRECHRILKPGGRLSVITPNAGSWAHRHFGRDWRGLEPPRHLFVFSRSSLGLAAAQAGLTRAQIHTVVRGGRYFWSTSRALRRARRGTQTPGPGPGAVVAAMAVQIFERLMLTVRTGSGDELVLIARKQMGDGDASPRG